MNAVYRLSTICVGLLLLSPFLAPAAETDVAPGDGTLAKALAQAKPGDVLKLAPGEYGGAINIPAGVAIHGAGPDKTSLTGEGPALIQVEGDRVTISGIELRPGKETKRGVNSNYAVRIECCRFVKFPHGVALGGAPLSDVIACEFRGCDIGVRAIGKASPTVWGCRFEDGMLGVFAMDGAPYIRNNLFLNLEAGIWMETEEAPIIRNNVFWKCKNHGVEVSPPEKEALFTPSVRNNIFEDCGDAVAGPAAGINTVSHCVMHASGEHPINVTTGEAAVDLSNRHVTVEDVGLRLDTNGVLAMKKAELVKGTGIRLNGQSKKAIGDIGLESDWSRPGCRLPVDVEPPPVRFAGPIFVVNAVAEEYVYIRATGCELQKQSLDTSGKHPIDVMEVMCGDKTEEWRFDVDRFFNETFLEME